MTLRYVNPHASSNGTGVSWADAYNTFAGITWGAHRYLIGPGALYETITVTSAVNGGAFVALDPLDRPVVDCQNLRDIGFNFNSTTGITLQGIDFTNQNSAPANGAIKITGSGHNIGQLAITNSQVGIHGTNCPGTTIDDIDLDIGNALTLSTAYGIRLINVLSGAVPVVRRIRMGTSLAMEYCAGILFENSDRGQISRVESTLSVAADHIGGRLAATDIELESSVLVGTGDIISLESAQAWKIRNNAIIHTSLLDGHFGPCLKLGDAFGAGIPPDNCEVENNLLVVYGTNNPLIAFNPAGANNTVNGNWLYAPNQTTPINYNIGVGVEALTYAEFEALGYQAIGGYGDPLITSRYKPKINSPLLTRGVDLGYIRDIEGKQGRKFIGAFTDSRLIAR